MAEPAQLRVLIVDDEPLARQRLRQLLADVRGWCLAGEAGTGREAIEAIRREAPDLVLLDIQLTDQSGFDVVATIGIGRMPAVVFVTAYDEFALRAFAVHAIDYILKPLDADRLRHALGRAERLIRSGETDALRRRLAELVTRLESDTHAFEPNPAGVLHAVRIMIHDGDALRLVPASEVRYFEAAGNYVRVHLEEESHLVRMTIRGLEADLDPQQFVRIHRSTILNLDFLDRLKPAFSGDWQAVLRDGTRLRASRHYVKRLRQTAGSDRG